MRRRVSSDFHKWVNVKPWCFGINLVHILQGGALVVLQRQHLCWSVASLRLNDDDWDYRITSTSFMHVCHCLAASTLIKNTKTCLATKNFCGVKSNAVVFVVPVTLVNFHDKCSDFSPPSVNSVSPTSLKWGAAKLLFIHMGISLFLLKGNMTVPQSLYPTPTPPSRLWSLLYRNRAWFWSFF